METIKVTVKLTSDERETIINYDNTEKKWIMDSTIPKHFNKALKQGWTPTRKYVYEDWNVCGMTLEAPTRGITIRNAEKKELSDKQKQRFCKTNVDKL